MTSSKRRCAALRRMLPALLCCAAISSACLGRPPGPLPPARVVGSVDEYIIGVPDVLQLTVWKQPDVSGRLLVRRDGKISVPLVGDVQAEGRSPRQLAADLTYRLSDFIAKPQVDIAVLEMRSQIVSVIGGGVVRSGVVELTRNTRVIDAIATSGGFTPFARKSDIRILRNLPTGQAEYRFDYNAFIRGRASDTNIVLEPGDTIVVPE